MVFLHEKGDKSPKMAKIEKFLRKWFSYSKSPKMAKTSKKILNMSTNHEQMEII